MKKNAYGIHVNRLFNLYIKVVIYKHYVNIIIVLLLLIIITGYFGLFDSTIFLLHVMSIITNSVNYYKAICTLYFIDS